MAKRSKRYRECKSRLDKDRNYSVQEALGILKSFVAAGFDETVELAVGLGIDPRDSEQQIRTSVGLPNGTGKDVRVAVFAEGEDAEAAREAGADYVGSDDLISKIEDGWADFDIAIAAPPMMRKIGKLGRFLGPRGLMPNPKNGTLTPDTAGAVEEFKAGKVEIRNDDGGDIHVPVGKLSFSKKQLEENILEVFSQLQGMRPPGMGRRFIQSASLSSSMGPGIRLTVGAA